MIKEFNYYSNKKTKDYQFGEIEILNPIESAIEKNIYVYNNIKYYKEIFQNINFAIKKRKGFQHADWVPIYLWNEFWCVSVKFKSIFEGKLKGYWYPTDDENYFIFLLDNCLDLIDRNFTDIPYEEVNKKMPWRYNYIENITFKKEAEDEYVFMVPELYKKRLSNSNFEILIKENNLTGFQFYKEINYKRKDGTEFDMFRTKNYNEDGDVII